MKRAVRALPHVFAVKMATERLRVLFRHDDYDVALAHVILGQIQHDRRAKCRVHSKVDGLSGWKGIFHQRAVDAERRTAAADENNAVPIGFI